VKVRPGFAPRTRFHRSDRLGNSPGSRFRNSAKRPTSYQRSLMINCNNVVIDYRVETSLRAERQDRAVASGVCVISSGPVFADWLLGNVSGMANA
jgi:hypothetical protein